jgi:folate-dependent phosphoribosylglycinamide formyltransferase PurN
MASDVRVMMLVGDYDTSRIMYNGIKEEYNVVSILLEDKPSPKQFLLRRIKKLGYMKVLGQVLFMILSKPLLRASQTRIEGIKRSFELDSGSFPETLLRKVSSVNDGEVMRILQELNPDVVVVNGTRIIAKKILSSVSCPFLNTHAGITPRYRGVHGGYWALTQKDPEHCGVTVHFVEQGIDTGQILYQDIIQPTKDDNFYTYVYLQYAKAIPLMIKAIRDVVSRDFRPVEGDPPSKLWSHPSLLEYIKYRILLHVK